MSHSQGFQWTKPRRDSLLDLKVVGFTSPECAELLSKMYGETITVPSVDNAWYKHALGKYLLEIDKDISLFNKEIHIPERNCVVSCDAHAPYHSEPWINRKLTLAERMGLKTHVIVGDLFDMGFAKWSKFQMMKDEGEKEPNLDEERESCEKIVDAYDLFDINYLICGNHEQRPVTMTDGRLQARHIIELMGEAKYRDKWTVSVYDKMFIGDDFMVVHPKSYSQIGGSTAVRLAEKSLKHVLNAHGHFVALRYSRSGKHMAADIGGMFDVNKIDYIQKKTTTHPCWNNGFAMIVDGDLGLVHEGNLGFWGLK